MLRAIGFPRVEHLRQASQGDEGFLVVFQQIFEGVQQAGCERVLPWSWGNLVPVAGSQELVLSQLSACTFVGLGGIAAIEKGENVCFGRLCERSLSLMPNCNSSSGTAGLEAVVGSCNGFSAYWQCRH